MKALTGSFISKCVHSTHFSIPNKTTFLVLTYHFIRAKYFIRILEGSNLIEKMSYNLKMN